MTLYQNYPNPFNPSTVINYQLAVRSQVLLKVYDILGKEVATLINEEKPAGYYEINFNASGLSSGIYFYRIQPIPQDGKQTDTFIQTKKLVLLK